MMECAFCGSSFADANDVIIPVPRPDGSEDSVFACLDCAHAQGVYCEKHHRAYAVVSGHGGKGAICMDCADADILLHVGKAQQFRSWFRSALPDEEYDRIVAWVRDMREAWDHLDELAILLRGILYEAHRRRVTADVVVADCIKCGSADAILPLAY